MAVLSGDAALTRFGLEPVAKFFGLHCLLRDPASIDDERRSGRESCVVGTEIKNRSSD
jgi:hypothetical protein